MKDINNLPALCYMRIGNYYGAPYLAFDEEFNQYYLCISDWDNIKYTDVSKEFAEKLMKEFEEELE